MIDSLVEPLHIEGVDLGIYLLLLRGIILILACLDLLRTVHISSAVVVVCGLRVLYSAK